MDQGFVWRGGSVGGDRQYYRKPFTHPGLVSDEAPILKLFVAKTHRARNLITGDSKAEASGTDSKLLALDWPYVESSKVMRGVLRVELDTNWPSWEALRAAILERSVPLPNVAVGHMDATGQAWRPHLLWILADSVTFSENGSRPAQAAWKNALDGLTVALLPLGADLGGRTNPHRHKNPVSPLWGRSVMSAEPYALDIDKREGGPRHQPLRPFLPAPPQVKHALAATQTVQERPRPDHPDLSVAFESNSVWRRLASVARQFVVFHRDQNAGSYATFLAELVWEALQLSPPGLRAENRARTKAANIAEWTWAHYHVRELKLPLSPEERATRERDGQAKAAAGRRARTIAEAAAAFCRIVGRGERPTQAAVSHAIGKSDRAIRSYWSEIMAAADQPEPEV